MTPCKIVRLNGMNVTARGKNAARVNFGSRLHCDCAAGFVNPRPDARMENKPRGKLADACWPQGRPVEHKSRAASSWTFSTGARQVFTRLALACWEDPVCGAPAEPPESGRAPRMADPPWCWQDASLGTTSPEIVAALRLAWPVGPSCASHLFTQLCRWRSGGRDSAPDAALLGKASNGGIAPTSARAMPARAGRHIFSRGSCSGPREAPPPASCRPAWSILCRYQAGGSVALRSPGSLPCSSMPQGCGCSLRSVGAGRLGAAF